MRLGSLSALVAGLAGAGFISAAAFAEPAPSLPERKAGLWELHTTMDEGLGPREQSLTMCIEAEMEHNTVKASIVEHAQQCTKYEITREGDKTIVDMSCQFASRHVKSRTELSGDYQKDMHVKIESATSGEQDGKTVVVNRTITQVGKYLSADCGDLIGGEAKAPDGTKVMVQ